MTAKHLSLALLLLGAGSALADIGPPHPPPPPPEPPPPEVIPPKKMEELRTAGSTEIAPDDATQKAMAKDKDKKDKFVTSWKVCITKDGDIALVNILKSSGYKDWDTKIDTTIRKTWKFKPYKVDGEAKAACTAETFIWAKS